LMAGPPCGLWEGVFCVEATRRAQDLRPGRGVCGTVRGTAEPPWAGRRIPRRSPPGQDGGAPLGRTPCYLWRVEFLSDAAAAGVGFAVAGARCMLCSSGSIDAELCGM